MGIFPSRTRYQGQHQSGKSIQRFVAEGAEEQIEPNDIRLTFSQLRQQAKDTGGTIWRPAAHDGKAFNFWFWLGKFVSQDR